MANLYNVASTIREYCSRCHSFIIHSEQVELQEMGSYVRVDITFIIVKDNFANDRSAGIREIRHAEDVARQSVSYVNQVYDGGPYRIGEIYIVEA